MMISRTLSDKDFEKLVEFIYDQLGIRLNHTKRSLVESRLVKRLRALKMTTMSEYCDYIFHEDCPDDEIIHMLDVITTNKTDFFREANHFDFMVKKAVPEMIQSFGAGVRKTLVIWSAGCSTGEEPYTIAMLMNEFASRYPGLGLDYTIVATDISTRVLALAQKGIYGEERIEPIPAELKSKYLLKSKDRSRGLVRITPELRSKVRFRRLNFMDEDFGFREPLDMIFCRNVMIYFEKDVQERLIRKFFRCMRPGSYLFIGHSESIYGMDLALEKVAPSIYRRTQ
jgi:chemotaxis protein methyltransferase CheR